MTCNKCGTTLEKCTCPDLAEKMRRLSGPGGPVAARWCRECDNHYARCYCREPDWMMRFDGKLTPLPEGV